MMKQLRVWMLRLTGLFRRDVQEQEFSAEMESHLQMHIDDGVRSGLSQQEARRRALIRLGGLEQTKIAHRERRGLPWLESLLRDVGYAARTLRRSPGFTIVSILILAAGIGANTSLFTVVRSVILRPLPFPESNRLVVLHRLEVAGNLDTENETLAAGDFYDWQKASHSFEQMAIWRWSGFNLSGNAGELPEFVNAAAVSWNLLDTLGVQPLLGRGFTEADDQSGASRAAILSWSLFKRRFNADPTILGKSIHLNQREYVVVGVLPEWLQYPSPQIQLMVPYREDQSVKNVQSHYSQGSQAFARLKPGVSAEQGVQELDAVQSQIYRQFIGGGAAAQAMIARPLIDDVIGNVKTPLYVLMAAVMCLLLIACLNLSNLLVARAATRRRAVAIRMALGSSRMRLWREQMTESLLICLAGGGLGLAFAATGTHWLTTHWVKMPRAEAVHPDAAVMAFALGITLLTGVLAGLLPAVSATGKGILSALQESSRSVGGSGQRVSLRKALLTIEVALTVVLLVCAGLLFKSFVRLRSVDIGCTTKNVLTMEYFLRGDKYSNPEQMAALHAELLTRVRAMPGVTAAGLTNVVPGGGYYGDNDVIIPEHPPLAAANHPNALFRTADPGYFAALQIPLLRGRVFTEQERLNHDQFVVINRKMVNDFFPNEDPLGKHLVVTFGGKSRPYEIIGVVGDTPFAIEQAVRPAMWFPILSSNLPGITSDGVLAVRSRGDVEALALPIQKVIANLDPELPVKDVLTMDQILGESTSTSSFSATLVLAFAILSLLLAAVGLYGVLAFLVTQRTTEIGVRMALGARREQVMGLVLTDGLKPALWGLAIGLAGSAAATQLIQSVLYATRPLDAAVYATVIGVLLGVAGIACLLPAWRAARIDPMQALRAE
jgi:predicted permease